MLSIVAEPVCAKSGHRTQEAGQRCAGLGRKSIDAVPTRTELGLRGDGVSQDSAVVAPVSFAHMHNDCANDPKMGERMSHQWAHSSNRLTILYFQ
jgi:hypothetical protein